MLKYRLLFGTLMTVFFAALAVFDGWLDGSLTFSPADDKAVQGTLFSILVAGLVILAHLELSGLVAAKGLKLFAPVSMAASVLFATAWYCLQFVSLSPGIYFSFLSAFSLLGLVLYQYIRYGTSAVLANCGANCFSIMYLGVLSAFCVAVRIDFGVWSLLTFVLTVKSADIGAYTGGSLFGRHKFSPKISAGKTWEGMTAAVATAMIVAILFAVLCDIMVWWLAAVFGLCFAFIGQMGDLAESLIKRDAGQKDSGNNVPGFGGIMDIVDSPLVAAPFAYLFFAATAWGRS